MGNFALAYQRQDQFKKQLPIIATSLAYRLVYQPWHTSNAKFFTLWLGEHDIMSANTMHNGFTIHVSHTHCFTINDFYSLYFP